MKKVLAAILAFGVFSSIYAEWSPEKTAAFIKEVEQAMDPDGKKKDIQIFFIAGSQDVPQLNLKTKYSLLYKSDKKWFHSASDGVIANTYYFCDGKCVRVDTTGGIDVVRPPVEDQEIELIKLAIAYHCQLFSRYFGDVEKISIADELEEYKGKKYIAVTCSFSPEKKMPAQRILIDPVTKLPACLFTKVPPTNIEVCREMRDYKKIHGILLPTQFITSTNSIVQLVEKYEEITVNENYSDSEFEYKGN